MSKKIYTDLLAYNYWANSRFHEVFLEMPSELADAEVQSSFAGLGPTVEHIAGAEFIWLQRLQNIDVKGFPAFDGQQFPDEKWLASSQDLIKFAEALKQEDFEKPIEYRNLKGEAFSNTVGGIIQHLVNHGTFHRGQLVSILRILGWKKIPSTDYIVWLRIK